VLSMLGVFFFFFFNKFEFANKLMLKVNLCGSDGED